MKDRIQKQGETDDQSGFYTTYKKYRMLFIYRKEKNCKDGKAVHSHLLTHTDFHIHKNQKKFYEKLTFLWVTLHGHKQHLTQATNPKYLTRQYYSKNIRS